MNRINEEPPKEPQFNLEAFDAITDALGYDNDAKRQRALRMSNGVMSRIRAGSAQPGPKFIRRMVAIGIPYAAVFPASAKQSA